MTAFLSRFIMVYRKISFSLCAEVKLGMLGYLAVAIGGFTGALARYALDLVMAGSGFPWSTLLVNVAGSLGLALFFVLYSFGRQAKPLTLMVTTGFFGSFTTFSAFSLQVFQMIALGRTGEAILYVLFSFVLGLSAVWVAISINDRRMGAERGESHD